MNVNWCGSSLARVTVGACVECVIVLRFSYLGAKITLFSFGLD